MDDIYKQLLKLDITQKLLNHVRADRGCKVLAALVYMRWTEDFIRTTALLANEFRIDINLLNGSDAKGASRAKCLLYFFTGSSPIDAGSVLRSHYRGRQQRTKEQRKPLCHRV